MASTASPTTAVIRGNADGYDMAKPALMGRQAAGHGFLRAAIQARGDQPIYGLSPNATVARGFEAIVKAIDPDAPFEWLSPAQLNRVSDVGTLYLADSTVASHARMRLRAGLASFSLCGVTHTTASQLAMNEIVGILREPVAPWDALVCTSSAVVETIRRAHESEADYLRWRFGPDARIEGPQLPIIPLGVHCDDFVFSDAQRAAARQALGFDDDEVVALFVGRLVHHAKAHPFPMFYGLQRAAERTGKRVALILCGWAPNEPMAEIFRTGAKQFAPDINVIFVEGRDPILRDHAWASSDIFVSLSDNIQETFGLTPIEAMAAGLPVVVSDWNGYRDTVRQGLDGFRISTWAPQAGMGHPLAAAHENGAMNYDRYCWATASTVSIDLAELTDALVALIEHPGIRGAMGESGRRRARELFDWPVVYRQYQALWDELNDRRKAAASAPEWTARLRAAPPTTAHGLDPFAAFGHYPTFPIEASTRVALDPAASRADLEARLNHGLFGGLPSATELLYAVYAAIESGTPDITTVAIRVGNSLPVISRAVGQLAKMGVVRLG